MQCIRTINDDVTRVWFFFKVQAYFNLISKCLHTMTYKQKILFSHFYTMFIVYYPFVCQSFIQSVNQSILWFLLTEFYETVWSIRKMLYMYHHFPRNGFLHENDASKCFGWVLLWFLLKITWFHFPSPSSNLKIV